MDLRNAWNAAGRIDFDADTVKMSLHDEEIGVDLASSGDVSVSFETKMSPQAQQGYASVFYDEVHKWSASGGAASPGFDAGDRAPDGSECDHPEDQREPVPYQGRPADPGEWECGACGAWNLVAVDPVVDDYFTAAAARAFGVPPRWTTGTAATSMADAIREASEKIGTAFETMAQGFFATKADPVASITVEPDPDPQYAWVGPTPSGQVLLNARPPSGSVVAPVALDLSDDDLRRVIFEMPVVASKAFGSGRWTYWLMDSQTASRVARLSSMTTAVSYLPTVSGPALILGWPVTVSRDAHPREIRLVVER